MNTEYGFTEDPPKKGYMDEKMNSIIFLFNIILISQLTCQVNKIIKKKTWISKHLNR